MVNLDFSGDIGSDLMFGSWLNNYFFGIIVIVLGRFGNSGVLNEDKVSKVSFDIDFMTIIISSWVFVLIVSIMPLEFHVSIGGVFGYNLNRWLVLSNGAFTLPIVLVVPWPVRIVNFCGFSQEKWVFIEDILSCQRSQNKFWSERMDFFNNIWANLPLVIISFNWDAM